MKPATLSLRHRLGHWLLRDLAAEHPEILDRTHILSVRSDEEQSLPSDFARAADDYNYHTWVQKAVGVWASSIAPLKLTVRRVSTGQTVTHDRIHRLLEEPNPAMDGSDLWRWWATDMALAGESGLEFVQDASGQTVEIYPRQPDAFHVRADPHRVRYWIVRDYLIDPLSSKPYSLPPDEFLHFKFYNPIQPFRGLSPATAVRLSILIDQLVQAWSRMFFTNSARPDFAVFAREGLTQLERRDIEARLDSKFGGAFQAHNPLVLEQGIADIKTFSFPRKDLEWIDQRRLSRDEIGAIWGVPDEIMGYGRDTYENFDTAERVLWTLTLVNLINFRDTQLTRFLRTRRLLTGNEEITTDLSRVWALRRAAAVQMKDAEILSRLGVPFNVIDQHLQLGIGPVPGGDLPRAVTPAPATPQPADGEDEPSSEVERRMRFTQQPVKESPNGNGRT